MGAVFQVDDYIGPHQQSPDESFRQRLSSGVSIVVFPLTTRTPMFERTGQVCRVDNTDCRHKSVWTNTATHQRNTDRDRDETEEGR